MPDVAPAAARRPPARVVAAVGIARLYLVALVMGLAVGLFSVGFLALVRLLTRLLWVHAAGLGWAQDHARLFTVVVCTLGGVAVGLVNRGASSAAHDDEVHDLAQALDHVDGPVPRPSGVLRLALLGVLSLGFGAALGPEAPLVVLVVALAGRVRATLHLARDDAVAISVAGALGGLFGAPMGAATLLLERGGAKASMRNVGPAIVAAVAGLWVARQLLPSGVLHPFEAHAVTTGFASTMLLAVVGALIGAVAALAVHHLLPHAHRLAARVARPLALRGLLGGLVLGLAGAAAPLALFSGHHEMQALLDDPGRGSLPLLGIAVARAVALLACLGTGWFGGEIFTTSAVGLGLAAAAASPFGANTFTVCGIAGMVAAGAVILQRPLAAFLLFVLMLPSGFLVVDAVAVAVAIAVLRADRGDEESATAGLPSAA